MNVVLLVEFIAAVMALMLQRSMKERLTCSGTSFTTNTRTVSSRIGTGFLLNSQSCTRPRETPTQKPPLTHRPHLQQHQHQHQLYPPPPTQKDYQQTTLKHYWKRTVIQVGEHVALLILQTTSFQKSVWKMIRSGPVMIHRCVMGPWWKMCHVWVMQERTLKVSARKIALAAALPLTVILESRRLSEC